VMIFPQMLRDGKRRGSPPEPSEVLLAQRASVVDVHKAVDTARDQATTHEATKEANDGSKNDSQVAWLSFSHCHDLRVAVGTNHVGRVRANRDDRCDDRRPFPK